MPKEKQVQAAADAHPNCCGRRTHDGRGWSEDFALAKRKAARQLGQRILTRCRKTRRSRRSCGLTSRSIRREQRARIHYLRERALERCVCRAVPPLPRRCCVKGTPGDIAISTCSCFTDDGKAVEFFLLSATLPMISRTSATSQGDQARAVSVLKLEWQAFRSIWGSTP